MKTEFESVQQGLKEALAFARGEGSARVFTRSRTVQVATREDAGESQRAEGELVLA